MRSSRFVRLFLGLVLLFHIVSLPAEPWEPTGLSGSGGMFAPAISPADPNLMMLNCDMSGAFISEDGGRSWRMVHQAQLRSDTRCTPGFHPSDAKVIFASSGGQLRVSRDRGKSFSPIGNLKRGVTGLIAIHPSHPEIMLVGTGGQRVARSADGGREWAECKGPQGRLLSIHFGSKDGATFVATDLGLWYSTDSGVTWDDRTSKLPGTKLLAFAAGENSADGPWLYCSVPSKAEGGVLRGGVFSSHDGGLSWQSAMGQGINNETKAADEYAYGPVAQYMFLFTTDVKPRTVYALNTATGFHPPHHETVFRTDDAGRTWRDVYFMDPRFKDYNVDSDYVTASTGQSFKGGDAPFGAAICASDPERLILVRNEVHVTHNGGKHWIAGHTIAAGTESHPNGQAVQPSNRAQQGKPGPGSTWLCNGLVVTTTWHYYADPFETNRHYIAYTDIGMARSLDAGKSWIWWSPKAWAPWTNTCYELAFDPETPGKIGVHSRMCTTFRTTILFQSGTDIIVRVAFVSRRILRLVGCHRQTVCLENR